MREQKWICFRNWIGHFYRTENIEEILNWFGQLNKLKDIKFWLRTWHMVNVHHFYSLQTLQMIFQIAQSHLMRLLCYSEYFYLNLFENNCVELIYNEKFFINLLSVDENGITVLLSHTNYAIEAITFFNWTRICNKIWIHLPSCLLTTQAKFGIDDCTTSMPT